MKLFKRKGRNNWHVFIHRKEVSLGVSDKRAATILVKEIETKLTRERLGLSHKDENKVNIEGFYIEYVLWRQEDGKTPHLIAEENYLMNKWIPFLNNHNIKTLDQISAKVGQGFITQLKQSNLSPKTIKEYISSIDRSLTRAMAWDMIKTNPFRDGNTSLLQLPQIKGNQCKPRLLTDEELSILFSDKKYGIYYEWLYYTGQRAGDVSALVYENINPDERELRLWIEKGDRYQVLALHQHLADKVNARTRRKGPVFPNLFDLDKKKRADKFKKARLRMQKILIDNGFDLINDEGHKAKLHSFRATSGQSIELNGGDRKDAAKHLSHSSEKSIDEYIHQDTRIGNAILDRVPVIKLEGVV